MRRTEQWLQEYQERRNKLTSSAANAKKKRPPKYGSRKTEFGGEVFDSKKEAVRYQHLKYRQAAGEITNLRRQVRYRIEVNGFHICDYIADAVYEEGGVTVVEDTKSPATRKIDRYRLKKKLMRAVHGIDIKET